MTAMQIEPGRSRFRSTGPNRLSRGSEYQVMDQVRNDLTTIEIAWCHGGRCSGQS
jgi:hypothetical protein